MLRQTLIMLGENANIKCCWHLIKQMAIYVNETKSSDIVGGFYYLYFIAIYSWYINYLNGITMLPCVYVESKNLSSKMGCEILAGWH